MKNAFQIRLICPEDATAALAVYQPYVTSTAITFEYEVPTLEEFANRINSIGEEYPWLVCECDGEIIGYAYGSKHRYRTAYQWSAESTIYMADDFQGKGIASILYQTLFELLKLQGYVNVYAGVALPNEKSEAFHKKRGFEEIGVFRKVGYKFGAWHDVKWLQMSLMEHGLQPQAPRAMKDIMGTEAFQTIIHQANQSVK